MSSDPDRDDMLAFQSSGERAALESLWRRHANDAWRLARWICGERAEDALQEAAVHLVQAAPRWRDGEPGSTTHWLMTIVTNAARDERRRGRSRWLPLGVAGELPAPDRDAQDQERQQRVHLALDRLAARHRQPVELRYLAGLDFPAVAAALGIPERTARTRVSRGLAQLRNLLGVPATAGTAGVVILLSPHTLPAAPVAVGGLVAQMPMGVVQGALAIKERQAVHFWPWLVLSSLAMLLVGGLLLGRQTPPPAAAQAVEAPPPIAEDRLRTLLDQPLQVRLLHDHLDEALLVVARSLPPGSGFRYALPAIYRNPWQGITSISAEPVPLRLILDTVTTQAGMTWTTLGGVVVIQPQWSEQDENDLQAVEAMSATIKDRQTIKAGSLTMRFPYNGTPEDIMETGGLARAMCVENLLLVDAKLLKCDRPRIHHVLGAAIARPETLARLTRLVLDPQQPIVASALAGYLPLVPFLRGGGAGTTEDDCHDLEPDVISPALVSPARVPVVAGWSGHPLSETAATCLRALVQRKNLDGCEIQALCAARVAASTRSGHLADAIATLMERTPNNYGESEKGLWRFGMAECLAALGDRRCLPILETAAETIASRSEIAGRALAALDAVAIMERSQPEALGWCADPRAITAIRRGIDRIATKHEPLPIGYRWVMALLRADLHTAPPTLAALLVDAQDKIWPSLVATTLARSEGARAVAPLLAASTRDDQMLSVCAQGLSLIEDSAMLQPISAELSIVTHGRPQAIRRLSAAAQGLACSRLAGAEVTLQTAIAARKAEDPDVLLLWQAALGGRQDNLAIAALAEVRHRGIAGAVILAGLKTARSPAAILGGWALVSDPLADPVLRLATLKSMPTENAPPERAESLRSLLVDRQTPYQLRAAALLDAQAAQEQTCRAAVRDTAASDPAPWVRACALFSLLSALNNEDDFAVAKRSLEQDADPQVRNYAAVLMHERKGSMSVEPLVTALSREINPRVRETIGHLLAQAAFVSMSKTDEGLALLAKVKTVAGTCLETEQDPKTRAVLQALRDGHSPGALEIGKGEGGRKPGFAHRFSTLDGRSYVRIFYVPTDLPPGTDPGVPFSDG